MFYKILFVLVIFCLLNSINGQFDSASSTPASTPSRIVDPSPSQTPFPINQRDSANLIIELNGTPLPGPDPENVLQNLIVDFLGVPESQVIVHRVTVDQASVTICVGDIRSLIDALSDDSSFNDDNNNYDQFDGTMLEDAQVIFILPDVTCTDGLGFITESDFIVDTPGSVSDPGNPFDNGVTTERFIPSFYIQYYSSYQVDSSATALINIGVFVLILIVSIFSIQFVNI
eukprot:TRINITY_DN3892_c0_g1_i1.p1 TRINITY_DN3892_c0_g1~~TRINITY_DN3892_c0_g1_i1.p1  ORF type:complete len:230 (-),score=77.13 TRINITY_DN3892_c0_g1_i1:32-721(-)